MKSISFWLLARSYSQLLEAAGILGFFLQSANIYRLSLSQAFCLTSPLHCSPTHFISLLPMGEMSLLSSNQVIKLDSLSSFKIIFFILKSIILISPAKSLYNILKLVLSCRTRGQESWFIFRNLSITVTDKIIKLKRSCLQESVLRVCHDLNIK